MIRNLIDFCLYFFCFCFCLLILICNLNFFFSFFKLTRSVLKVIRLNLILLVSSLHRLLSHLLTCVHRWLLKVSTWAFLLCSTLSSSFRMLSPSLSTSRRKTSTGSDLLFVPSTWPLIRCRTDTSAILTPFDVFKAVFLKEPRSIFFRR